MNNYFTNPGQVRLHLYGNIDEANPVEPDAKRARKGSSDEEVFQEGLILKTKKTTMLILMTLIVGVTL